MEKETCCCHKTKERSEQEYKSLINRLNRIEGQVRGVKSAALNSFSKELLASHIRSCVVNDIRDGKEETIDELVATIQKLMR